MFIKAVNSIFVKNDFFTKAKNIIKECFSVDTETSKIIIQNLPIKSKINTWSDEIYFDTKIKSVLLEKDAKEVDELGEIAYWTEGNSVAIGIGPAPISLGSEIRLISKCNYWANTIKDQIILDFK